MKITFLSALAIVFIVLKLTNVIDWSWWLVTSPLWIGLALAIVLYIIAKVWVFFYGLYLKKAYPKEYAAMKEGEAKMKERQEYLKTPFADRLREMQKKQEEVFEKR